MAGMPNIEHPPIEHAPRCGFLSSHPTEGDEAATCTCGAWAAAEGEYVLREQLRGAVAALDALTEAMMRVAFEGEASDISDLDEALEDAIAVVNQARGQ